MPNATPERIQHVTETLQSMKIAEKTGYEILVIPEELDARVEFNSSGLEEAVERLIAESHFTRNTMEKLSIHIKSLTDAFINVMDEERQEVDPDAQLSTYLNGDPVA